MKIVSRYIIAFALFAGLPTLLSAQGKEISRDEFYKGLRDAHLQSSKFARRQVQKIRSNWNDKLHEEQWTYEYQLPDRVRFIHVETFDGKTHRTEQINVGETKYCKKDNGEWALTKSYCIGGSVSSGPSNIIKETYTSETTEYQGKRATLYREYTTYKNTYSKTADTDGPSFDETKFWIDDNGIMVRYESHRGLVANPSATYEMIEIYEYDPKIKIEKAPIK